MKRGFPSTGNLLCASRKEGTRMAENEKTDIKELKTEEQSPHNPGGILTKR